MRDQEVLARHQIAVGVRNTAISGSNRALRDGISQAIRQLKSAYVSDCRPDAVVAAGMITSGLGLHEVKHVQAPASLDDLAGHVESCWFDNIAEPVYFLPGVRSGPTETTFQNVDELDIMRGEETEIFGVIDEPNRWLPLLYVHLGSHTKLVRIDSQHRIAASASTLAGELAYALQEETILRSSLGRSISSSFNETVFQSGWDNCEKLGITRALFQIRLLDLYSDNQSDLSSFFLGILLREEFRCFKAFSNGFSLRSVILSGLPHLQSAWRYVLERSGMSVEVMTAGDTEVAFLNGLWRIFLRHTALQH